MMIVLLFSFFKENEETFLLLSLFLFVKSDNVLTNSNLAVCFLRLKKKTKAVS